MLQEEIRINDKFVSVVKIDPDYSEKPDIPIAKISSQSTNIFLKKINEKFLLTQIGMTPANCRYIESLSEKTKVIIIEEPPSIRTLFFFTKSIPEVIASLTPEKIAEYQIDKEDFEKELIKFNLALPYIIFIMVFNGSRLDLLQAAVRPKPIISLTDNLFVPPFLNINESFQVCLGEGVQDGTNIVVSTEKVLKKFWATPFNRDYANNFVKYKTVPIIGNLFDWQYNSQENPMFIYKVDWIPMDQSCQSFLTTIKSTYSQNKVKPLTYIELHKIFDMKQKYATRKKVQNKPVLYEDVCNGINLLKTKDEPATSIYIGDPFHFKNKNFFIETFLSFDPEGPAEYLRFLSTENKQITMKLTKKTRAFLLKQRKKLLYDEEATLPNGIVVKAGDILILENMLSSKKSLFKKIIYIRKGSEGFVELRAGDQYLIVDNIPKTAKKLDFDDIKIDGVKLEKDQEYFIVNRQGTNNAVLEYLVKAKFKELSIAQSDRLVARFLYGAGEINLNLGDTGCVFKGLTFEKLPKVIYLGRLLMTSLQGEMYRKDNSIYFTSGIGHVPDTSTGFDLICKELLQDGSFIAKSSNLDIIFSVGDEVVISNWDNPIDMLKIKTIIGISKNTEKRTIDFHLVDKDNVNSKVSYVEKYIIYVGTVRKIIREYNGIKRGSKIVAKEGLKNFPKGSVNIIIGFLNDTGTSEPLVFCSNALTLWFSDLEKNFDIIEENSKDWNKLVHEPINLSNIEMQPGDIVECTSGYKLFGGFVLFKNSSYDAIIAAAVLKSNMNFSDYYNLDRMFLAEMKFNAILNPRISLKEDTYSCLPNLHGGYYRNSVMNYSTIPYFQPGKGREFDVSNSD
jgi:hypothetical protein